MGRILVTAYVIRSQTAEDVCEFVWLAVAAYGRAEAASRAVADWQRGNELDRAVLSAMSEIVSHVEVFVVESLLNHAEAATIGLADPIPTIVADSVSKAVDSTWAARRTFIRTWLNEDLSGAAWWKKWMGFVEARNAWAHGLGTLTTRQLRNQEVLSCIKAAGLTTSAARIVGKADDVRACGKSAVEVIDWIDQRVKRP